MTRVIKGVVLLLVLAGLVAGITVGLPMFRDTFTSIAVAAVNLSPGMQIRDGMVAMRMWRREEVPEGAVFSLEGIMGRYVSERVAKDQPIFLRQVTDVAPPPVRMTPRWGYSIVSFAVTRATAADLFVGDKADITVVVPPTPAVTLEVGWPIHYIDCADPLMRQAGFVLVYFEVDNDEYKAAMPRGEAIYGPSRIVRAER